MMRYKKAVFLFLVFIFVIISCGMTATPQTTQPPSAKDNEQTAAGLRYEDFKALSNEEQISTFAELSSPEIYYLVKSSDSENWPVTSYDLVTENNAKDRPIRGRFCD